MTSPVLPPSRVPDPQAAPSITWGIIAPGGIAHTFARAVLARTASTIGAVGSRSLQRAQAFATEFGAPRAYGSYEELVADDSIDAVYVASPHSEHHDHALLALAAGKPVLVEKAFTRSAREAREVLASAREHHLFAMEAMWSRFLPHYDMIRTLLADGALGEVVTVTADHGQYFDFDPVHRLFDPEKAGGALLDLGVYPISFGHMVSGGFALEAVTGTLTRTGVDSHESLLGVGSHGEHLLLDATLNARTPTTATISGTEARLELGRGFYTPTSLRLVRRDDSWTAASLDGPGDTGMAYEAAEAARLIRDGATESQLMPWHATLEVMEIMDQVRAELGVRYPGEA